MKKMLVLAGLSLGMSFAISQADTTIFEEDFESYGLAEDTSTALTSTIGAAGWTIGTDPAGGAGALLNPAATGKSWRDPNPSGTFLSMYQGQFIYIGIGATYQADTVYEFSLDHFRRDDIGGDGLTMRLLHSTTSSFNTNDIAVAGLFSAVTTAGGLERRTITFDTGANPAFNGRNIGILIWDSNGGNNTRRMAIDNLSVVAIPKSPAGIVVNSIITGVGTNSGKKVTIDFTAPGLVDVYASDDLSNWSAIATNVAASPFIEDDVADPKRFYVVVTAGATYPPPSP